MMNTRSRRPIVSTETRPAACQLCGYDDEDVLLYGEMFKGAVTVHHYCMLSADGLPQNGGDDEGFMGFLVKDIKAELQRPRQKCSYCQQPNARVRCMYGGRVRPCGKYFHYPCLLHRQGIMQFYDDFRTLCSEHRPTQKQLIGKRRQRWCQETSLCSSSSSLSPSASPSSSMHASSDVCTSAMSSQACPYCMEPVGDINSYDVLLGPCCKRGIYHRECLQSQALSAGRYFFRCGMCNNSKSFLAEMMRMGINVPIQDAAWETEDGAFEDLLTVYSHCDADVCLCEQGRDHSADSGAFSIKRCDHCGQAATHLRCSGFSACPGEWRCPLCTSILTKAHDQLLANSATDTTTDNASSSSSTNNNSSSSSTNNNSSSSGNDINCLSRSSTAVPRHSSPTVHASPSTSKAASRRGSRGNHASPPLPSPPTALLSSSSLPLSSRSRPSLSSSSSSLVSLGLSPVTGGPLMPLLSSVSSSTSPLTFSLDALANAVAGLRSCSSIPGTPAIAAVDSDLHHRRRRSVAAALATSAVSANTRHRTSCAAAARRCSLAMTSSPRQRRRQSRTSPAAQPPYKLRCDAAPSSSSRVATSSLAAPRRRRSQRSSRGCHHRFDRSDLYYSAVSTGPVATAGHCNEQQEHAELDPRNHHHRRRRTPYTSMPYSNSSSSTRAGSASGPPRSAQASPLLPTAYSYSSSSSSPVLDCPAVTPPTSRSSSGLTSDAGSAGDSSAQLLSPPQSSSSSSPTSCHSLPSISVCVDDAEWVEVVVDEFCPGQNVVQCSEWSPNRTNNCLVQQHPEPPTSLLFDASMLVDVHLPTPRNSSPDEPPVPCDCSGNRFTCHSTGSNSSSNGSSSSSSSISSEVDSNLTSGYNSACSPLLSHRPVSPTTSSVESNQCEPLLRPLTRYQQQQQSRQQATHAGNAASTTSQRTSAGDGRREGKRLSSRAQLQLLSRQSATFSPVASPRQPLSPSPLRRSAQSTRLRVKSSRRKPSSRSRTSKRPPKNRSQSQSSPLPAGVSKLSRNGQSVAPYRFLRRGGRHHDDRNHDDNNTAWSVPSAQPRTTPPLTTEEEDITHPSKSVSHGYLRTKRRLRAVVVPRMHATTVTMAT